MDKRHLHHAWTKVRRVKPAYIGVVAISSTVVCVFAMRSNYKHMTELRAKVYEADKSGTDVNKPLKDLQQYVTSHMNTSLSANASVHPPIQLQYTYKRLVEAQGAQTQAANAKLYNDAQAFCEGQNSTDVSGRNRVPCIEQYVRERTTTETRTIADGLYKFDFLSPKWSPDLAGWSMVIAVLAWLALLVSFVVRRWFKRKLRG